MCSFRVVGSWCVCLPNPSDSFDCRGAANPGPRAKNNRVRSPRRLLRRDSPRICSHQRTAPWPTSFFQVVRFQGVSHVVTLRPNTSRVSSRKRRKIECQCARPTIRVRGVEFRCAPGPTRVCGKASTVPEAASTLESQRNSAETARFSREITCENFSQVGGENVRSRVRDFTRMRAPSRVFRRNELCRMALRATLTRLMNLHRLGEIVSCASRLLSEAIETFSAS